MYFDNEMREKWTEGTSAIPNWLTITTVLRRVYTMVPI